jgi:hypothetical protein
MFSDFLEIVLYNKNFVATLRTLIYSLYVFIEMLTQLSM